KAAKGGKSDRAAALELPFETLEVPFAEFKGHSLEAMALPLAYRGQVSAELSRVRDWREHVTERFPRCKDAGAKDEWASQILSNYLKLRTEQEAQPFRPTWWPDADLDDELFVYDAKLAEGVWNLQRRRIQRAGKRQQREFANFGDLVELDPA